MIPRPLEEIDLAALARHLRVKFGATLEIDYLDGRTVLRDAVAAHLGCSLLTAEDLVEMLETSGYLEFPKLADDTHSQRMMRWRIG
jgi:hypothetical protein